MKKVSLNVEEKIQEIEKHGWTQVILRKEGENDKFQEALCRHFAVILGRESVLEPALSSNTAKSSLSKEYGYARFPFHTDGANLFNPPRLIALRYLGKKKSNVSTLLLDGLSLLKIKESQKIVSEVYLVKSDSSNFYSSILSKTEENLRIFRYNSLLMSNVLKPTDKQIESLISVAKTERINWEKNMTIYLDNWRMLHAREAVTPSELKTRKIKRTFFLCK